jgi:hypothetical protein
VPNATNLFNKAWEKRHVRAQVYKKKTTKGKATHIVGGNRRCMCFKRNIDFLGLLRAFEASGLRNLLDRSPGNPRRNVWLSRLIDDHR